MQRWLSFHPYNRAQHCDHYYLKLCKEIYDLFRDENFPDDELAISDEEKMDLACFLVCYFEDVISGPGLWRAFTIQVNKFYGKFLPFFDLDPDEYYPDEINPEDIYFLMWYYLSMVHCNDQLISPMIYERLDQSERIFEILEREYEAAPNNYKLKQLLHVIPEEYDFYIIREKLKWIMLDSWLHHFLGEKFMDLNKDLLPGERNEPIPEETRSLYLMDAMDSYIHLTYTPLLARQGKEWLAYILGKDHPLFRPLLEMGEKKSGFYLYLGKEGDHQLFRYIATGTELRVHAGSMEVPDGSKPGRSIMYGGFVKWKDKWWFTGAQLVWGEDDNLIRNEQESEESKRLFKDPAVQKEENRQIFNSFLNFNKGTPLAFVENVEAAKVFIRDLLVFHDRSTRRSARWGQKGRRKPGRGVGEDFEHKIPEPDVVTIDSIPGDDADEVDTTTIPGMIYCDPETGIELVFGYNDLIPDSRNTWYAEDGNGEDRAGAAMMMMESQYISGNWMKYLVSSYDLPGLDFPGPDGQDLLLDNLDFMLRFWKRKDYYG